MALLLRWWSITPLCFGFIALKHVSDLLFDFLLFNIIHVLISLFLSLRIKLTPSHLFVPILKSIPNNGWLSLVVHGIVWYTPYPGPMSALRVDTALTKPLFWAAMHKNNQINLE